MNRSKKYVQKKLNEFAKQLNGYKFETPDDFKTLKEYVIYLELKTELGSLQNIFNKHHSIQKSEFINHCRYRNKIIHGTFLDFKNFPNGLTNILYLELIKALFEPRNMFDLISLLYPKVTECLTIEDPKIPNGLPHKELINFLRETPFVLKKTPINFLKNTKVPPDLSQWIISNKTCFNLMTLKNFNYNAHTAFYTLINQYDPILKSIIYSHNQLLSELENALLVRLNQGETPKTAIIQLAKGFRLGGALVMGSETQASEPAQRAIFDFWEYLKNIPLELHNQLLKLKSQENHSLGTLLKNLSYYDEDKGCVQTAASELMTIARNSTYAAILETLPRPNIQKTNELKKRYSSSESIKLITSNEFLNQKLPDALTEIALEKMNLDYDEDFIILMLRLSPDLYSLMMSLKKTIKLNQLLEKMANGVAQNLFSEEQVQGIIQGFKKNLPRIKNSCEQMIIAIKSNHPTIILDLLNQVQFSKLSGNTRLLAGFTIYSLDYPKSLRTLLSSIPPEEIVSVLFTKLHSSKNILQQISEKKEALRVVLDLLPDNQRLTVLKSSGCDYSILDHVLSYGIELNPLSQEYKNSFIPYYIQLHRCLRSHHSDNKIFHFLNTILLCDLHQLPYLFIHSTLLRKPVFDAFSYDLYNILEQYDTIEDVQTNLFKYMELADSSELLDEINAILSLTKIPKQQSLSFFKPAEHQLLSASIKQSLI